MKDKKKITKENIIQIYTEYQNIAKLYANEFLGNIDKIELKQKADFVEMHSNMVVNTLRYMQQAIKENDKEVLDIMPSHMVVFVSQSHIKEILSLEVIDNIQLYELVENIFDVTSLGFHGAPMPARFM